MDSLNNIKFKYIKIIDTEGGECDCCGSYYGSGEQIKIYHNDKWVNVYTSYSDGHLWGIVDSSYLESFSSVTECILEAIEVSYLDHLEQHYSEENRLKYNESHYYFIPKESSDWLKLKEIESKYFKEEMGYLRGLEYPYDTLLCLKVILLWLEDRTGIKGEIYEEESNYPDEN